jgi:hypothetical protein
MREIAEMTGFCEATIHKVTVDMGIDRRKVSAGPNGSLELSQVGRLFIKMVEEDGGEPRLL